MPDTIQSPEKSPSVFESDLKKIESQINKFKELPEAESMSPREIVKESIKQITPSPVPPPPVQDAAAIPKESEEAVNHLLGVALTDGVAKANQLAKNTDPFVMDSFHDALVGKYYPELQKRGIID